MREPAPKITLTINGATIAVPQGTTVAAAVLLADACTRLSISGAPRAPLCGMGICFECRVAIGGVAHQRSCQILCRPGMQVVAPEAREDPGTGGSQPR